MSAGIASSLRSLRYANTEGGLGREPCKETTTEFHFFVTISELYQHVWWGNEILLMDILSQNVGFSWKASLSSVRKLLVLSAKVCSMFVLSNNILYLCSCLTGSLSLSLGQRSQQVG